MTETDKEHGRQHAAAAKETNLHSPPDRGAKAEAPHAEPAPMFTPEQLATPAPSMVGFRQMYIIVGPYKGNVLTMPDAEAEDAKDSHWAVEMETVAPPFDAENPPEHDHELTDEDRAYAVEAANAWAAKVNDPPPDPPADESARDGETEGQRTAREKRNADRKTDYERRKTEHDHRHADRPRKPDKADDKALHPGGAGGYQTRAQPEPTKRK